MAFPPNYVDVFNTTENEDFIKKLNEIAMSMPKEGVMRLLMLSANCIGVLLKGADYETKEEGIAYLNKACRLVLTNYDVAVQNAMMAAFDNIEGPNTIQ